MKVTVDGLELELTVANGMLGIAVDGDPKGSIRVQEPEPEPEPEPIDPVTPDTDIKVLPPGWVIDPLTGKAKFTNPDKGIVKDESEDKEKENGGTKNPAK